MLQFDGKNYRTIADLKEQFRVSEKTVKNMVRKKEIRPPKTVVYGTRRFLHYDDEWVADFAKLLAKKRR